MHIAICVAVLSVIALCCAGVLQRTHMPTNPSPHTLPYKPTNREPFGNADYYLRGDGNWTASQMAGATPQSSGTTGMAPAPTAGQQNSYLRGDGTWQQANNAPTAAILMHVTYVGPVNTPIPTANGTAFTFNTVAFSTGATGIITPSPSPTNIATFVLAAGYTYKCTAQIGFNNTSSGSSCIYQWSTVPYEAGTSTLFGVVGAMNNTAPRSPTAIGYIAVSTATTISLIMLSGAGSIHTGGPGAGAILSPWATIEAVSNNNTIGPFMGATQNTNGVVGYIPAPPAGAQNSYLRGDGNWVQANNAPTAAILMHAIYIAAQNTPVPTTNGVAFPFNTIAFSTGTSGVITPSPNATNITTFVLAPGNTYKCTAQIGYSTGTTYQWSTVPYAAGTTTLFGVIGDMNSSTTRSATAIGYITVSTTTTISLIVLTGAGADRVGTGNPGGGIINAPWATIEVVSNNNTITQFAGATASAGGTIGYMPAPVAGQQNSYLRGDGTWQQANNGPTAAQYYMAGLTQSANAGTAVNANINFDTPMGSLGNMITQPTMNTFLLAAGASYKLRACVINARNVQFAWYNITTGAFFGINGISYNNPGGVYAPGTADGFITTTTNTTVGLRCTYSEGAIAGVVGNGGYPYSNFAWAIIEQTSNNNTITAFSGATASSAGAIGYVPAPPTGTQNAYLRGDGTWQSPYVGMVQQAVYNTTSAKMSSTVWADVPNLTVTVTPISVLAKFLLRANIIFGLGVGVGTCAFRFMRGTTPIGVGSGGAYQGSFRASLANIYWTTTAGGECMDAPATTSAVTYSIQYILYDSSYSIVFNNSYQGGSVDNTTCPSTLTITQC